MALNPNYDAIGKAFVQQYYALFDDKNARPNLVNLYNVSLQRYQNDFWERIIRLVKSDLDHSTIYCFWNISG